MAINPVGTVGFGAQTQAQEKKKSSPILPAIAGAAVGAGVGSFTKLGKTPEFDAADTFIKSSDAKKNLEEIKDDSKAADKTKLTDAKTAYDAAVEKNKTTIGRLFPKDDSEATVTDVLKEVKDSPSLADLQASLADKAEEPITNAEKEVTSIKEAADSLEKGKDKIITIGDSAVQVKKDDKDVVTFVRGKEEGEPKAFKAGSEAPVDFAAHQKSVEAKRAKFTTHTELAKTLGIDAKTTGEVKIKKAAATSALDLVSSTASSEVKTAFENLKDLLPKKISVMRVAGIAAAGAALAGLAAVVLGGGSDKK